MSFRSATSVQISKTGNVNASLSRREQTNIRTAVLNVFIKRIYTINGLLVGKHQHTVR